MNNSYQEEIPKARVNITLDVETGDGRRKKELPLKLLVLGDFSNNKTNAPISEREKINIDKHNFDQVVHDIGPTLNFTVPNRIANDNSEMCVQLKIDSMRKFHPEEIIKQIPELRNLIAMRNLLKDLKANLLDNTTFREELQKIIRDEEKIKQLRKQLNLLINSDK